MRLPVLLTTCMLLTFMAPALGLGSGDMIDIALSVRMVLLWARMHRGDSNTGQGGSKSRGDSGEQSARRCWVVVDGDRREVFVTDRNSRLTVKSFPLGALPG